MNDGRQEWDHVERRKTATQIANSLGVMISMIGLAITFLVQFGGSIWWGATLSADLRHVTDTLARMEAERYTKSDATRDIQRIDQGTAQLRDQVNELRATVRRNEERLDAIQRR